MKRIRNTVRLSAALVALIIVSVTPSMSQATLKLGGGFGVLMPRSDLKGSTLDYYSGTNYGLGNGLNLQAKAKVGLVGFNLTGEVDYASLSNSGNSAPGQGSVDVSQKIFSLKVGPEFRFGLPLSPITPYIGANIAMNRFSGETTFRGVAKVPSATYSVEAATRLGVGFSAGAEVSIGPLLSLDFNLAYNLMNLSGKEWNDVNPGTDQRLDSYLALNDSPDPQFAAESDKHVISGSRSIQSILFTVSVLFGM
jgi:opacity protein-like surface antigen